MLGVGLGRGAGSWARSDLRMHVFVAEQINCRLVFILDYSTCKQMRPACSIS